MIRLGVLALDGCIPSSIHGMLDVLSLADSRIGQEQAQGRSTDQGENRAQVRLRAMVVSPDGRPASGLDNRQVRADRAFDLAERLDVLIVPAFYQDIRLARWYGAAVEWVRDLWSKGCVVCSVCAGAFLLADTGLLEGRPATTHWNLAGEFRALHPGVDLRPELMLVDQGEYICAGGVTAYMDLALHLVERYLGREAGSACRSLLLVDGPRQEQTPYVQARFRTRHDDAAVARAQDVVHANSGRALAVEDLARASGLEPRTLSRRFRKATGSSPLQYVQQVRLDRACDLLESSALSVEQVAGEAGYQDTASFCRLFRKRVGLSPGAYRKRFGRARP